jgi:predicted alpha/beta superfamily hydrolase
MKSFNILIGLLLITISANIYSRENIISGAWHAVHSKTLNEERRFAVYLPPSYKANTESKYPVMYLLDGNESRFRGFTGLVESLSTNVLASQIPEFIIVAIPNTDRNRDLTPTAVNFTFKEAMLDEIENSGGAKKFMSFLETEFIPHINKTYRTSAKRVLVGESFGGLFAAHVLLTQPTLFSDYLITDATNIWDNNYLNRKAEEVLKSKKAMKAKVYLSLANNNHLGEIGQTNLKWGREFALRLKEATSDTFKVKSQYFDDEVHATVALLSWYNGLLYLFKTAS